MAQPPELPSSLGSAPVKPRLQQGPDAVVQKRHDSQPREQLQSRQATQLLGTAHVGDAPTWRRSGPHFAGPGLAGDDRPVSDGVSRADASSNDHLSAADPAGPAQGAQREAQHKGDAPVSNLPDMSNTQPPPGAPRQPAPATYPSAGTYPHTSIPTVPQYMYPLAQAVPPADPYRPSPTTLPSMRTLEHRQPQVQVQPPHGLPFGAPGPMAPPITPAPAPATMGYYPVHPHAHMYGLPDTGATRFPLPLGLAHDPRIALSGGRHKKEIKRRTKTGCLTCRKRRIKCDEAHPTCNNCKKSKRECLGYDPIFKQQQGPAAIQPAPSSQPPAPTTAAPAPTVPSSAPNPYRASYPAPVPPTVPPSVPSSVPHGPAITPATQAVKAERGYDYSTAIDPALQGAGLASAASTRAGPYQQNNVAASANQGAGGSDNLPAKNMKLDELIALGGAPPQLPSSPPSAEVLGEITKIYYELYVPGLTLFFETQWYDLAKNQSTTANPESLLHNNNEILVCFTSFLRSINKTRSTDPVDLAYSSQLEARLIWSLARLPLSVTLAQRQQHPGSVPTEDEPWELRGRLAVFEALVSGETLASNPLSPSPAGNVNFVRRNELEFWYQLANYLLQEHASASPAHVSTRGRCLGAMRSLLDGRENRDVLYSIAVLREYTPRWDATWNERSVPSHLEESDARSKLAVATRFIRDESISTGGTTNVVRRFTEVAFRAFVQPAVNVDRTRCRS